MIPKSFIRFLGVGVINTLVGTTVMFLCYNAFGLSYWLSSAANYIVGSIVSFYLNRTYTFNYQKRDFYTIIRFIIGIAFCYVLAYGAAKPLASYLLSGFTKNVQENIAMVFGTVFFILINYATQRWFTFRVPKAYENSVSSVSTSKSTSRVRATYSSILKTVTWIAILMLSIILVATSLTISNENRWELSAQSLPTWIALTIVAVAFTIHLVRFPPLKEMKGKIFNFRHLIPVAIITFAIQILMIYYLSYTISWDPLAIFTYAQASLDNNQNALHATQNYFSMYPNNIFLAVISSAYFHLLKPLGLNSPSGLAIISALHVDVAALTIFYMVKRYAVKSPVTHFLVTTLFPLLVFSAWVIIPYSDTLGLPYVAASFALFFSACRQKIFQRQVLLFGATGFAVAFSYTFKPSNIVILVALFLTLPLSGAWKEKRIQRLLTSYGILGLAFILGISITSLIDRQFEQEINPEKAFTWHHYLMMGANEETFGSFMEEDVFFSSNFETVTEREEADFNVAQERIIRRSLTDNIRFYATKIQRTYSDGSFGALWDGFPPKGDILWERSPAFVADTLRKVFYYTSNESIALRAIQHILWFSVLLLAFGGILLRRPNTMNYLQVCLSLSIIGLTAFLTLFETRPRYLFVFLPVFIMLAAINLGVLREQHQLKRDMLSDEQTV